MTGRKIGQLNDKQVDQKTSQETNLMTGQKTSLKADQHTDRDALLPTNDDDQQSQRDTVITMDHTLTEEEMMENIKTHRDLLAKTKTQNWPMHKKLRTLRKVKMFLKK